MNRYGVFIEYGVKDWQIFQRVNGKASLRFGGSWISPEHKKDPRIYVRVLNESTGKVIVNWFLADTYEDRSWTCELTLPEGGLYMIQTCLLDTSEVLTRIDEPKRGDMIHHVGVGDIFVISGQSNASGFGHGEAIDPPELGVHILKNTGDWDLAVQPLNDSTDSCNEATYEPQVNGSSPYLSFARAIKAHTGCPVGLLQNSRGGRAIRYWAQDGTGELFDALVKTLKMVNGVKAVLWYQGCSDTWDQWINYYELFENFVNAVREKAEDEELPFFTVQLNRHLDTVGGEMNERWAMVRDAQRRAVHGMKNIYLMTTEDLAMSDGIHNSSASNVILGNRVARQVLGALYGETLYEAPEVTDIRVKKNALAMKLVNCPGGLVIPEAEGVPFFSTRDEAGEISLGAPVYHENSIAITLLRAPEGDVRVSGGDQANPCMKPPYDAETGLPMVAFYNMKAERE